MANSAEGIDQQDVEVEVVTETEATVDEARLRAKQFFNQLCGVSNIELAMGASGVDRFRKDILTKAAAMYRQVKSTLEEASEVDHYGIDDVESGARRYFDVSM